MANHPPPLYPPPAPPYGNDWKYQRRVLKQQARAQREAYRNHLRGQRRSSILGPILLIALGILFLLVQTNHLESHHLWDWYSRFWPLLLVGAGVILVLEWALDQYVQSDPAQPQYRRRIGGGVLVLLILLGFTGLVLSGIRQGGSSRLFPGLSFNQDNLDEFMGDKHESDQSLTQPFPAGAIFTVDNPRGDVTISGTSDDNQIHVAVHKEIYTRSDSEAATEAQRFSPNLNASGSRVTLSMPPLEGGRADLTITLPAAAAATVTANHGDIHISALKSNVQATANHGDIELSAITGNISTHINNSGSSLSAHSVTGSLSIEGRGRDTTLSDLSGPVIMGGDYFGTTHFERIRGPIKFHTSRTDFQLGRLDGEVEISNADISASDAVGPVTLTTGNRNITLERIAGDIVVTNRNGSVDLTSAPPLGNVTVENRNGSVDLTVPEQSSFAYQFEATNGDIESGFSQINIPDGGLQKKTVSGTIGNGGPMLHISTSQGDLSLKRGSIPPLPPAPPAPPKITGLPPEARQSIEDARQQLRDARQQAKAAAASARQEAKEAAAAGKRAAQDAQRQSRQQNQ